MTPRVSPTERMRADIDQLFASDGDLGEVLEQVARLGARLLVGGAFLVLIAALMPFATARVPPLAAEELSMLHQGRLRRWGLVAVGTAQQVVAAAVGTAGGAPATGAVTLGVAPSMGSTSGPWGGGPRGGDTGGQPTGGQPPSDDVPPSGGPPAPAPRPGTRDIEVEPPAPPAGPAP